MCEGLIPIYLCGEPGVFCTKTLLQHQKLIWKPCFWELMTGLYIMIHYPALIQEHIPGTKNMSQVLILSGTVCLFIKVLLIIMQNHWYENHFIFSKENKSCEIIFFTGGTTIFCWGWFALKMNLKVHSDCRNKNCLGKGIFWGFVGKYHF